MIEIISRSQNYSLTKERRRHHFFFNSFRYFFFFFFAPYDLFYLSHIAQQQQRLSDNNRAIVCVAVFFMFFTFAFFKCRRPKCDTHRIRIASQQQTVSSYFFCLKKISFTLVFFCNLSLEIHLFSCLLPFNACCFFYMPCSVSLIFL